MRNFLLITVVLCFVLAGCGEMSKAPQGGATLTLSKKTFSPGETIEVKYTARADYADNAWVGIIPSNIPHGDEAENDKHDLAYQYLNKSTSGTLKFSAPKNPGEYDFRMHDKDANGKEVASVSFLVSSGDGEMPTLKIDKTEFAPGAEIKVHFTAPATYAKNAWIGIIPSDVPHGDESKNDQHDISYKYIDKKTSGTMVFKAPEKPGSYDFRMHDTDSGGKEVVHVTFTVK
jgi:hypothetical protein